MNDDVSSTQLLHGYQYHAFREAYDRKKLDRSRTDATSPSPKRGGDGSDDSSIVPTTADVDGDGDSFELRHVKTLQFAHGHRKFPAFEKLFAAAALANNNTTCADRGTTAPSPRRDPTAVTRPRSPTNNISSSVFSVILGLRSDPVEDDGRHSNSSNGFCSPIANDPDDDDGHHREDDDVDWGAPAGGHQHPRGGEHNSSRQVALRYPCTAIVRNSAFTDTPWLRLAATADGDAEFGEEEEDYDDPFGAMVGRTPDPTLDTGIPSGTQQSSHAQSYEDRVRRRIDEKRKKNRAALWRKITYGASAKGIPTKQQLNRSTASPSPHRRQEMRRGTVAMSKPGQLVSIGSMRKAPSSPQGQQLHPRLGSVDGVALPPALMGDASMGTFYRSPGAASSLALKSSANLRATAGKGGLQQRTKLQQALSGDMPSKHDVVAALSAAKEHFSHVALRSVYPVVPITLETASGINHNPNARTPPPTSASPTFEEPDISHSDRLANAGLNAALLSRVAMSVSHADYRLASAMKNAKKYLREEPLLLRAWGVTDTAAVASIDGLEDSAVSAFPAKWMIASSAKDPLEVRVAIAWDPFPSMFEESAPATELLEYVLPSAEEELLQEAWAAMRVECINSLEEAGRLGLEERAERGSERILSEFRPLLLELQEAPRTMWRQFYAHNLKLVRWLVKQEVAPVMLRRYQRAVIAGWEKASRDRNRLESCVLWWRWLHHRRKARYAATRKLLAQAEETAAQPSPSGNNSNGSTAVAVEEQRKEPSADVEEEGTTTKEEVAKKTNTSETRTKTITSFVPRLHILRCRALAEEDTFSANDPFVVVSTKTVKDDSTNNNDDAVDELYRTPAKEDEINPSWNAASVGGLREGSALKLTVFDQDVTSNDIIGAVTVTVPRGEAVSAGGDAAAVQALHLLSGDGEGDANSSRGRIEIRWSADELTEMVEEQVEVEAIADDATTDEGAAKEGEDTPVSSGPHRSAHLAALLEDQTTQRALSSAWNTWCIAAARLKAKRHLAALDQLVKAKPAVRAHRETVLCALALHEGLLAALEELGTEGHSITLVGHGCGGTLACALAVILNREAANYAHAPSAHSVITVGSPRLALDDPAVMFEALAVDVVCFGNPTDPAVTCPLHYKPSSPGLFHLTFDGAVECVTFTKLNPIAFNAHEHWKYNNIDMYITRFLNNSGSWGQEFDEPRLLELEIERGTLALAMDKLKKQSTYVRHGFTLVFLSVLQQLHTSLCAKRSIRVSRNTITALTLLMSPQQPIFALQARIPMGRKGLLDFPTFVEWLWSEHYSCPGFLYAFMAAASWKWDSASGTFIKRSQVKLPGVPAMDPFLPLVVPLQQQQDAADGTASDWCFSSAARLALEHMFSHYSRVIPASPFDVHCSGVAVATFNCLVLLLQHSRWTHSCSATRTVDAVLTLVEQSHSERPRAKLMNYGGNLTFEGFVEFMRLLVDWFGEGFMLERLWVLGYNGLYQHSITRGALQNIHAKGGPYDYDVEDRWLTRLRHDEEAEFNEWVSTYIRDSQRDKLATSQALAMHKVASMRCAPLRKEEVIMSSASSMTSESTVFGGASRKKKKTKKGKNGSSNGMTSALTTAKNAYGTTAKLHNWTATGDNSRSRLAKSDPHDDVAVFTGKVETSVGVRLNGPLSQLARANQRKVLPKLTHNPRVNKSDRVDRLYTDSGVVHLVNPVQRALLGVDDMLMEDDGDDDYNLDQYYSGGGGGGGRGTTATPDAGLGRSGGGGSSNSGGGKKTPMSIRANRTI